MNMGSLHISRLENKTSIPSKSPIYAVFEGFMALDAKLIPFIPLL